MEKRYPFAAFVVLASTVVTPFAEVGYTAMGTPGDQLYFVWGRYSLLGHLIRPYGEGGDPFPAFARLSPALLNLVVLWIACGIALSAIILYSSRTSHQRLVVWAVVALVLMAQNQLLLDTFGGIIFIMYSLESIVFFGVPSIMAIVALVVLQLMRRQPDPYLIGLLLMFLAEYGPSAGMIFLPRFSVFGAGLLLVIVAAGYLLADDRMDKRAADLHHLGTALIVLGHVSLIEWGWTFPVAGFGLFCCGFIVILHASDRMDKRAANLRFLGSALFVLGYVLPWVNLYSWAVVVTGLGILFCGFIVILVARLHKTSSGADSISYLEASQRTPS
ncbi:MAG: hypothetical protein ACXABV_00025 [Candidatus Thorarchaeota archaeon]